MRASLAVLVALGLSACTPPVPESGPGFQDYGSYMRSRDAALSSGSAAPTSPVFSTERLGAAIDAAEGRQGGFAPAGGGTQTGALIGGAGDAARPRGNAPAGIQVQTGEMARIGGGISDENSFDAVSARETIESDRQRLEQQRAQYQVIQPGALPQRTGSAAPNIVQFALSTRHNPGTPMYQRSTLRLTPATPCTRYASPDLAQEDFLAGGGPQRDRKGLDPDGDGFACGWDPRPFRNALR